MKSLSGAPSTLWPFMHQNSNYVWGSRQIPHVEISHREKAGRATPQQKYKKEGGKVDQTLRRPQTYVCIIIIYKIQQICSECVKHNEVSDRCPLDADTFLPLNSNFEGLARSPISNFTLRTSWHGNSPTTIEEGGANWTKHSGDLGRIIAPKTWM